jgi:hypothetical protein
MSARRQIIAALSEDSLGGIATLADVAHAEQLVDAHRAEVFAEAAEAVDAIASDMRDKVGWPDRHAAPDAVAAVRAAAREMQWLATVPSGEKATTSGATATPEFFQAERTYQHGDWVFRCDVVTADPNTGKRTAIGWSWFEVGYGQVASYTDAHWADGWTDVTGAGEPRG